MKYVVVLGDGMADRPIAELGDQTPRLPMQRRRQWISWQQYQRLEWYTRSRME